MQIYGGIKKIECIILALLASFFEDACIYFLEDFEESGCFVDMCSVIQRRFLLASIAVKYNSLSYMLGFPIYRCTQRYVRL